MAFDLDSEILPWVDSNALYPDHPALTWRRVLIITFFFLFFKCIQYVAHKIFGLPKRRAFKIVSSVHSCIAVVSAFYLLHNYHSIFGYITSGCQPIPYAHYIFSMSFGYFAFDLYKTMRQEPGLDFIIHGLCSIGIYGILIHTGAGEGIGLKSLLYESSTPFLHLYAFLHYADYHYLARIVRLVFASLFFTIRIVYGTYVTIQLCHAFIVKPPSIEWDCVPPYKYWAAIIINIAFHCLNLHWFRLIVNKAWKVWKHGKEHALEKPGETLEFDKRRQAQGTSFQRRTN
eukprot:391401_1